MSRSDSPQSEVADRRVVGWDDTKSHFPVFCLAEIPDDYFTQLNRHRNDLDAWIVVSSASPSYSQVVSEIKRHLNKDDCVHFPKPFLGQTVRQVYSFFKNHLRRPEDKVYDPAPFTHFTFLAVDAECVRPSEPLRPLPEGTPFPTDSSYSILVCTDAPDWNECGPQARMKTLRLPISAVFEHLLGLEELTTTPSEIYNCIFDSNGTVLKLFPPPTHLPVATFTMDENQKYTTGTPAQMRLYKSNGLRLEEHRQRRESTGEER